MVNERIADTVASMTGYAAREGAGGGSAWSWEIRSVNGRGLDLRMRLPDGLGALEAPLRKALSAHLTRGNVTVSLRLARAETETNGVADDPRVVAGLARLEQLRAAMTDRFGTAPALGLADLLAAMPGTSMQPDLPDAGMLLHDAEPLIADLNAMRLREGAALAAILAEQLTRVEHLIGAAARLASARSDGQAARLRAAVEAVLETADGLDEARLLQELALIATKSDISEEIVRLHAHVSAARALLAGGGPIGRKLDFLMQEFNREANTLCSKSQDAPLTAIGLDLKLVIDQMREQVQNVE